MAVQACGRGSDNLSYLVPAPRVRVPLIYTTPRELCTGLRAEYSDPQALLTRRLALNACAVKHTKGTP